MEIQEFDEQIDRIRRYNDSLSRHAEGENHPKIQYYIEKLRKLPIKMEHLQATRIGKSVNQLRGRFDGKTKDLVRKCVNEWKEMVKLELAMQEKLEEKAKAEEARKKILMEEEQEKISREKRDKNAALNHSEHHGEASSSHQRVAELKHKSHKRSHSRGDHQHSEKMKKHHHDKDKHHKSHDHHSKHDREKNEHRHEDEDKKKSKSKKSEDRHKIDVKKLGREQVEEQVKKLEKERAKDREEEQSKRDKFSDKSRRKESSKDNESSSGSSKFQNVVNIANGIDSGSGASFAEALGMCDPISSKSATLKKEIIIRKPSLLLEKRSNDEKVKPTSSSVGHFSSKNSSHPKSNPRPILSSSPPDPNDSLPTLFKEPAAVQKLPIKLRHLQATGIGKAVDQMRGRFDGETKDLRRKCFDGCEETVKLEQAKKLELEEQAKAEEARKKNLMEAEQEMRSRDRRNKNAVPNLPNHSKHQGKASSSHQGVAESKHQPHKRSHSSGADNHSKKLKKDHSDNDKHHKSHDHHSKHDEEGNEHRYENEDKHKSKSRESKDRHKKDGKKQEREQVKEPVKESSEDKKSSGGSSKFKSVINIANGIDSGSGASFAEALGMCEPTSSRSAALKNFKSAGSPPHIIFKEW